MSFIQQRMADVRRKILDENLHVDSNMFVLLAICHGDDEDNLMCRDRNAA